MCDRDWSSGHSGASWVCWEGLLYFSLIILLITMQVKGAISTVAEASVMSYVVSNKVVQPQHCLGNPGFMQLIISVTEDMP